jgi:hypothetical protein
LTIHKPNLGLISCWWVVVSLAFTKDRHGIKNYSIGFGIDGEKKITG